MPQSVSPSAVSGETKLRKLPVGVRFRSLPSSMRSKPCSVNGTNLILIPNLNSVPSAALIETSAHTESGSAIESPMTRRKSNRLFIPLPPSGSLRQSDELDRCASLFNLLTAFLPSLHPHPPFHFPVFGPDGHSCPGVTRPWPAGAERG